MNEASGPQQPGRMPPAKPAGDFEALVRSRLVEILVLLLRGTLVLFAVIAVINTAAEGFRWAALANIAVAAGGIAVLLALVRRGRIELAVIGLIFILFTLVFGSVYLRGTTRVGASSIVIPVAALAGLFLGRTALIASLCLCALALGGLTYAEAAGLLGPPAPGSLISFFAVLTALAAITGLVLYSARTVALQALGNSQEELDRRRRTELALRESEQRFRSLSELSSDSFWESDSQHRITTFEAGAGYAPLLPTANLIGKTRWETGNMRPVNPRGWAPLREDMDGWKVFRDFELSIGPVNGETRWYAISGEPLFDADRTFVGYQGVTRQITERKLAQTALEKINAELDQRVQERTAELRSAVEKLEEANRDLDSFNFSIAHDLRQPLNAIGGFSDLLREDFAGEMSDEGLEFAQEIQTNAERMEHMIEALLRFSNVGRGTLNKVQVDMREQVESVLRDLSVEAPLRADVSVGALPVAQGDGVLLRHVWTNLIGNALKYSGKGAAPRVEVSGVRRGGFLEYTVRDNGVGFDMRDATHIFGVFQRLPSANGFEGSGVGLAIVERIVRRHGGQVRAESALGEGATFRFTLPA